MYYTHNNFLVFIYFSGFCFKKKKTLVDVKIRELMMCVEDMDTYSKKDSQR